MVNNEKEEVQNGASS